MKHYIFIRTLEEIPQWSEITGIPRAELELRFCNAGDDWALECFLEVKLTDEQLHTISHDKDTCVMIGSPTKLNLMVIKESGD